MKYPLCQTSLYCFIVKQIAGTETTELDVTVIIVNLKILTPRLFKAQMMSFSISYCNFIRENKVN